jgi:heme oxygenase
MSSLMLGRLDEETRALHTDADEDRLALLEIRDVRCYRDRLVRIYGFEAPVEAGFLMTAELGAEIDLRDRTKHRLLKYDLNALGVAETARLPRCTVPLFGSAAEALGWMYVIDRNALVHGVIRRQLAERQVLGPSHACYLSAHEMQAGARWRELGAILDRAAGHADIADRIVASARLAFRRQHQWYGETPSYGYGDNGLASLGRGAGLAAGGSQIGPR